MIFIRVSACLVPGNMDPGLVDICRVKGALYDTPQATPPLGEGLGGLPKTIDTRLTSGNATAAVQEDVDSSVDGDE